MSGSIDNAGAVQTWPLQTAATVAVAPLPQDVAAVQGDLAVAIFVEED